jgi:hypothetical protein
LKNFPLSALTRHLGISSETIPLFEKNLQIRKNGLFSLHRRQNSYYIIAEFRLDLFIVQHVAIEDPAGEHSLLVFRQNEASTDSNPLFTAATSEPYETWQYAARTLSTMSPTVSRAVWRFGKLGDGCALNYHVCESASERTTNQTCFPWSDHRRAEADFSNRSKWYFDSL